MFVSQLGRCTNIVTTMAKLTEVSRAEKGHLELAG
jgi:hypothetical protein